MSSEDLKRQALSPEQQHELAQKNIEAQRAKAAASIPPAPANIASTLSAAGVDSATLEDIIKRVLDKRKEERIEEFIPKEPDYKALSEKDIFAPGIYIPVIEHDIPDGYQPPLKFDSEGNYIYQDVICMRVHKRIRFAKIRKFYEMSRNQLKP